MRVLVFGATGCVGTALELVAPRMGIAIDGLSHQDIDVTDRDAVADRIRAAKPDAVINAVAMPSINPCEQDPQRALLLHAQVPLAMIDACNAVGAKFVYTSSHAVFDGTKTEPWDENDEAIPLNVYGATKRAGEMLTLVRARRGYVVRYPTLYGPRRNVALGFVDKMEAILGAGGVVTVATDHLDAPSYSLDIAAATLDLVAKGAVPGLYHVANAGMVDYHGFISALREQMALTVPLAARATVAPGLDGDFPALAAKPLRTALISVKGVRLRPWRDALRCYAEEKFGRMRGEG